MFIRFAFSACFILSLVSCYTDYSVLDREDEADEEETSAADSDDVIVEDDTDDAIDTGSGVIVGPTGLIGGVVQLGYTHTPCVDCFIGVLEIDSFAAASFHTPQARSWYDWIPSIGSCSTPSGPAVNPSSYYDVGQKIYLNTAVVSNQMNRMLQSGKTIYQSNQLANTGWRAGENYSLSVGQNSILSDFNLQDIVSAPVPFTHVQPSQMFTPDASYAFSGVLRRSYVNQFSYVPAGDSDLFILTIDVYDETGNYYLGGVMCVEPDGGTLTMPAGRLSSFPSNSLASVTFYKWRMKSGVIPSNGATVEGIGQYGVVGTAILQ